MCECLNWGRSRVLVRLTSVETLRRIYIYFYLFSENPSFLYWRRRDVRVFGTDLFEVPAEYLLFFINLLLFVFITFHFYGGRVLFSISKKTQRASAWKKANMFSMHEVKCKMHNPTRPDWTDVGRSPRHLQRRLTREFAIDKNSISHFRWFESPSFSDRSINQSIINQSINQSIHPSIHWSHDQLGRTFIFRWIRTATEASLNHDRITN